MLAGKKGGGGANVCVCVCANVLKYKSTNQVGLVG